MESTNGGKTKLIVIAIIIIVAAALFMWWSGMQPATAPAIAPATSELPAPVTSASLTQMQNDAATVDTGNIDAEFQSIDKDVNSL